MPTYDHVCTSEECKFEWEDFYSIKADPPKNCPQCNKETVQRLISGGCGRGIVELTGRDLVDKVKADAQVLKREAYANERTYSNIIGESRYQSLQQRLDKQKR